MSATIPFLTEIDTRAEVKGSRDPLGLVAGELASVVASPELQRKWERRTAPRLTRWASSRHQGHQG